MEIILLFSNCSFLVVSSLISALIPWRFWKHSFFSWIILGSSTIWLLFKIFCYFSRSDTYYTIFWTRYLIISKLDFMFWWSLFKSIAIFNLMLSWIVAELPETIFIEKLLLFRDVLFIVCFIDRIHGLILSYVNFLRI